MYNEFASVCSSVCCVVDDGVVVVVITFTLAHHLLDKACGRKSTKPYSYHMKI